MRVRCCPCPSVRHPTKKNRPPTVNRQPLLSPILIFSLGLVLGLMSTGQWVLARGEACFTYGIQIARHIDVMEWRAGDPWQYRVLAPYLLNPLLSLFEKLQIPDHAKIAFITFRVLQDAAIVIIAFYYYREIGLAPLHALMGMMLLSWSVSHASYDSDLQFNTFFDVMFYLLAALCVLRGRYKTLIPLTAIAALNRETSALIPFLLLPAMKFERPLKLTPASNPLALTFSVCLATYIFIFISLRMTFGTQYLITPYGHQPGLDILKYNFLRPVTYLQLLATLNIIPILALAACKRWPRELRAFAWIVVPVWFLIHAFSAVLAETRLLLVPQALIFIPGALSLLQAARSAKDSEILTASAKAFKE